ncbi:MAG TPA: hypothetical protein VD963_02830 [Phycisphaerales bacterium]|nr:hypothetical protein [Phycisphaerales bacterium]
MQDLVGWTASAILLVTIIVQVRKQYRERTSKGVSRWLFVGQLAASAGFVAYSLMVGDTVFVFTNAAVFVSALVGLVILLRNKAREAG